MTDTKEAAPRAVVAAMFLTTLVTLALQVCASRILSVTLSYHYAFLIVALAMLGMAAAAITVFLEGKRPGGKELGATRALTVSAVLLAAGTFGFAFAGWFVVVALAEAALASAFYFCGYVVAWTLSRYAHDVPRLYLFDLLGASAGCVVSVVLLDRVSALDVMLLCACALAAGATLLARPTGRAIEAPAIIAGVLVALGVASLVTPQITRLRYAKFSDQSDVIWERWNSLARVTVRPYVNDGIHPTIGLAYWGLSPSFRGSLPDILWLELDANAGTPLIRNGGRGADLEFLRWDVTSTAYWLAEPRRPSVFIIGGGGGRDILTAATFGAKRIDVVEINPAVVTASRDVFGDYAGGVYELPQLHVTVGNARRELARSDGHYDVIQMSMIDTWAASMSGQLTLTENTLYTREAFDLFYSHLADEGVLAISRWYDGSEYGEVARVLSLMGDVLARHGAPRPTDHIAVLYTFAARQIGPVASCIMKRSPFTAEDVATLTSVAQRMDFKLLWPEVEGVTAHEAIDPRGAINRVPAYLAASQFDLVPPTDERPFFFNMQKTGVSFAQVFAHGDLKRITRSSVFLWIILAMLLLLGFRFLIVPLRGVDNLGLGAILGQYRVPAAYFAGIGMGFMLVEIALIQRFIVFLGHPTYALSVVLFSLLLFSAIGSAASARLRGTLTRQVRWPLAAILALTLASAFFVTPLLNQAETASQAVRMVLVVGLIAPLAFCLGMIFPTGIRILNARGMSVLIPWMWGVNGFAAVVASVVGMIVAMAWGYTFVLLLAVVAYGVTLASTRALE